MPIRTVTVPDATGSGAAGATDRRRFGSLPGEPKLHVLAAEGSSNHAVSSIHSDQDGRGLARVDCGGGGGRGPPKEGVARTRGGRRACRPPGARKDESRPYVRGHGG